MRAAIALVLVVVFASLAVLHVLWAFGVKLGSAAAVPVDARGAPTIRPGPLACLVVATGLLAFAVVALANARLIELPFPGWASRGALWFVAAIFTLRAIGDRRYFGLFRTMRGTAFARMDARLYTPLCLAIAASSVALQLVA